jgi:hypothetical protein
VLVDEVIYSSLTITVEVLVVELAGGSIEVLHEFMGNRMQLSKSAVGPGAPE